MKKKFIPILAAAALVGISSLAACNPSEDKSSSTNPTSSETSSQVTPTPTPSSSTTPVESSSEDTTVRVTGVTLTLAKTTLTVGESTKATVEVAPANATNKAYDLTSTNPAVATVSGDTITAIKAGTTDIKVTTKDGAKESKVTLTVEEPLADNPSITIAGDKTLTVVAGANLTLPVVKATARDGKTDLTADIEAEDYDDSHSLSADYKTFNSKIAGQHTISYYVQEGDGEDAPYAEETITINVTPVHENTFVTEDGDDDPEAVKNYGTFKDGFEKGISSKLYKGLGDANNATELSATEEAIEGNSLIIDLNKTSGSAMNSVFINTFTSTLIREKAITYEVSFDYKPLSSGANYGNVYFGQRWDGMDGNNAQFVNDTTVNKVSHYSRTFTEVVIPTGGNAGFFFFKLAADTGDCKVAIDNFTVTAKKCVETTDVIPTSEELEAEDGFTFNWSDKSNKFGSGETFLIEDLKDETVRTAIANKDGFGVNTMRLTGRDDHVFNGLNSTNLVAGKKLTISFKYYCVNDNSFNFLVMAPGGVAMNDGLSMTTVDGNIKQFVWSGTLPSGIVSINFYPQNADFDIYMGNMNVKLSEADPLPEDETELGNKVGANWTNSSRSFGGGLVDGQVQVTNDFATPSTVSGDGIGSTIAKFEFKTATKSDANVEWYHPSNSQIEKGHEYKITLIYFVESLASDVTMQINIDNNYWTDASAFPTTAGYHKEEVTWTATKSADFFSLYFMGSYSGGIMYVASSRVELIKINK